jgi:hypothetical protein
VPGKIVSKAQQGFLAIHNPKVLHELSGGKVAKGLPEYVAGSKAKKPGPMAMMFGGKGK